MLVHVCFTMASRDCVTEGLCHQAFLIFLPPGEASLASNLLRQNESKSSLPHKINHFSCTKSARPLHWEHNWHQTAVFHKLSNQQSISQENRHYVTSSPTAISESLNIKSCAWYDPSLFVVLKIKCLLESCLEEDVSFFRNPHYACVSFPYLSLTSMQATTLKEANTCCETVLPDCFAFSFQVHYQGRHLEIPVLHIYTQRELYIDLSDGKGRILHSLFY